MKKVLIITYYWIPSGGAGVQRWVKFTKYLREFGWEPVIFTPENPEYPSVDESFKKDIPDNIKIIKIPIWEPYNVYRNLFGKRGQTINAGFISESEKSGWKEKLSIAIRGNFLIPDPRKFWIKPSVKFIKKYLSDKPVDAVITTGPPHSMHMIALGLKKHFPHLPWIADFRDPWTNIDFYKELNLNYFSDKIHHRMEKQVVRGADLITVVSQGMYDEFIRMQPKAISMIPNGYDESDVSEIRVETDKKFSISHIGTLNAARNPEVLWEALSHLCAQNVHFSEDLRIQLVGKVDFSVIESIQKYKLNNNLIRIDYLPHAEAIRKQQSSQLLMLLINNTPNAKGILTGKFFEYLASGRPVIGVGPVDGDASAILRETGAGVMIDYYDVKKAEEQLLKYYELYRNNQLSLKVESVINYSRRNLTGIMAELLNQLTQHA